MGVGGRGWVWVGVGWVALETGSNGGVAQDVRVYSKGTNSTKKESYKKGIVQKRNRTKKGGGGGSGGRGGGEGRGLVQEGRADQAEREPQ